MLGLAERAEVGRDLAELGEALRLIGITAQMVDDLPPRGVPVPGRRQLVGPRQRRKGGHRADRTARHAGFAPRFIHIRRSEEHTSELQSLMRHSYAVFCLKKKK